MSKRRQSLMCNCYLISNDKLNLNEKHIAQEADPKRNIYIFQFYGSENRWAQINHQDKSAYHKQRLWNCVDPQTALQLTDCKFKCICIKASLILLQENWLEASCLIYCLQKHVQYLYSKRHLCKYDDIYECCFLCTHWRTDDPRSWEFQRSEKFMHRASGLASGLRVGVGCI